MTLSYIKNWFNNLPPKERNLPLVTYEGNAYTPQMVLNQVRDGTKLGQKLQQKVESGQFTQNKVALAKARLKQILQKPEYKGKTLVGQYTLGEPTELSSEELQQQIEENRGAGKQLIQTELERINELMPGGGG